jgi:septal ring factor EnvC (AmiA/AmiB activator)
VQKDLEKGYSRQIEDMNRKFDQTLADKENEMATLDSQLNNLNQFKNTKQIREENLRREIDRFERLKKELDRIKKNGKIEME